jgi:hypothetical protein
MDTFIVFVSIILILVLLVVIGGGRKGGLDEIEMRAHQSIGWQPHDAGGDAWPRHQRCTRPHGTRASGPAFDDAILIFAPRACAMTEVYV